MICPKWLVQTSAVGVLGAALIALPALVGGAAQEHGADQKITAVSAPQIPSPASDEAHKAAHGHVEQASVQARQTAHTSAPNPTMTVHGEWSHGPLCPVRLQIQRPEAVDQARSIVEKSHQKAVPEGQW